MAGEEHDSAVGPLARSAAHLRTALLVTAGPKGPTARAYFWTLPPTRHARLEEFSHRCGGVVECA